MQFLGSVQDSSHADVLQRQLSVRRCDVSMFGSRCKVQGVCACDVFVWSGCLAETSAKFV